MTMLYKLKKSSDNRCCSGNDVFTQIVGYSYTSDELDRDIRTLIADGAYRPSFSDLMQPYLKQEADHFKTYFNGSEPFNLTIENLGIVCNKKMQPTKRKIELFLSDHHIESESEQSDFNKALNEEYFGSGFIHRYQTATNKDDLIYLYDMVENPFYTLYTFAHELTHAMQDKNEYQPYGASGVDFRTDYREIHANLTAGTFMLIKALQTKNPKTIQKTIKNLLLLSSRMSQVMKTPKYGVRYFDWKGLNQMLMDIPDRYQDMLTPQGNIDWNKLYTYTSKKVLEMDYTPVKIRLTKDFLAKNIAPLWRKGSCNRDFAGQIKQFTGKNPITDDFAEAFNYLIKHLSEISPKAEQFYQQLAKPAMRSDVLYLKMYNDIPNIESYRRLDMARNTTKVLPKSPEY